MRLSYLVWFLFLAVVSWQAKFAGAGTLVPITGFANSVAAPAIEFQKEGMVFGIGCKIFTIAANFMKAPQVFLEQ